MLQPLFKVASAAMCTVKNTERSTVQVCFDGRVQKFYRGSLATERLANEVRVLRYLEKRGCEFVPRVLDVDAWNGVLEISNCGMPVEVLHAERLHELFAELETFGVRHLDPMVRNVTYDPARGRFCLIDFEFAEIVETGEGLSVDAPNRPSNAKAFEPDPEAIRVAEMAF